MKSVLASAVSLALMGHFGCSDKGGAGGALQERLDEVRMELQIAAVAASVRFRDGSVWVGTSGTLPETGQAIDPMQGYPVGSVTKNFTAVIILGLVAEGRIRLEDTVANHVPYAGSAANVTLRQVLQHTSGIPGFLESEEELPLRTVPMERGQFLADTLGQPLRFTPGTQYDYSNTNYILLGAIAELATGQAYHELVRQRILVPLGMNQTYLDGFESASGGAPARGPLSTMPYQEFPYIHPSWLWAAGGLVSTMPDQLRYIGALSEGSLLSPELGAEMKRGFPTEPGQTEEQYGLGTVILELDDQHLYGHDGAINGIISATFEIPETGMHIATYCVVHECPILAVTAALATAE